MVDVGGDGDEKGKDISIGDSTGSLPVKDVSLVNIDNGYGDDLVTGSGAI
jgi:hypothetical protein